LKKVLHIINGEFFAGAERVQDLLALNLPKFGYECDFVCLKEGVFNDKRQSKTPLTIFSMQSKFDLSVSKKIIELAKLQDYKLIHTHTARNALIGRRVSKALKIPLIHHVHSPTARDTESFVRNWLNTFIEDHLILPSAQHLIPVSYSLKDYLLEHNVPEKKITPVPNGVPIVSQEVAWKKPTDDCWVIGTVALFRPRKGLEVLLRSIKALRDSEIDIRLKAVGTFESSEYEATIKQLATDLEIDSLIEWTGFSSDVHTEIQNMHVFVLPSLFGEGLPMVMIEAMSVGIPVVSTFVEGIPHVLEDGKAGIIVEPNNEKALAEGIKLYICGEKDPYETAQLALIRQAELFSDIAMTKAVSKVYDLVIKQYPVNNDHKEKLTDEI